MDQDDRFAQGQNPSPGPLVATARLFLAALLFGHVSPALAVDVPVSGKVLAFQWYSTGIQRLVFETEDPALPFPEPGSGDDPATGTPGGVTIEVFSSNDDSVATYAVPKTGAAPGWTAPGAAGLRYTFRHDQAPRTPTLVKKLRWKKNRRFRLAARFVGLDQVSPRGSVAVRVTAGSTRFCAVFGPPSIQLQGARGFFAGPSVKPDLADCSDETLGTAPPLSTTWHEDPWCADDFPPIEDVVDPDDTLYRVTLRDPLAVCNDGSPAVMFIRRAPADSEHANDWVIWLQGGSSCGDPGRCADRWCQHQQGPYSAKTMSSRWEPLTRESQGIFSRRGDNLFRDFNIVQVSYCSSDEWAGAHTIDVPAGPSESDPLHDVPAYRIAFHGNFIVNGVLLALMDGVTADADASVTLPRLETAGRVMFAGTSAGAAGAVIPANRGAGFLNFLNPDAVVELVADAIARPYEADGILLTDDIVQTAREAQYDAALWRGGYLDQDCMEAHPADPEICTQQTHVLFHHVNLRAFSQFDLSDNTVGPWLYPVYPPFVLATRALYQGFASLPSPGGEDVAPTDFGYFAPNCAHHTTLADPDFYSIQIDTPQADVNLHDALWVWWQRLGVPRLVDDDATPSTCPE
jgi:hypothetical protein